MKVQNIYLQMMRNDSHFQYHTEFIDSVNKHGAQALGIKPQFDAYVERYNKLDSAFKKINKSALTKSIHDKDKERDNAWYGLVDSIAVVLKRHADPVKRESARKLKIVTDTYGNIARKPVHEQTSAVHNILQDLTTTHAADVAVVGVGEWVTELRNCNAALDNLVKERFDETAAKSDVVLKQARAELDEAYYAIIEILNARIVLEGLGEFEPFVRTQNAIIAKFKSYNHKHHNRYTADADDDTDVPEAEEETEEVLA